MTTRRRFSLGRMLWASLALMVWASPLSAATYYVRPDGNDQADGKSPPAAFQTVRQAAHALDHGDALVLAPGTYRGAVLLAERFSADGSEMLIAGDEGGRLSGRSAGPVVIRCDEPGLAGTGDPPLPQRADFRADVPRARPGAGHRADRGPARRAVQFRGADPGPRRPPVPGCPSGKLGLQPLHVGHLVPKLGADAAGAPDGRRVVFRGPAGVVLRRWNGVQLDTDRQQHEPYCRRDFRAGWTSDYNVLEGSTGPWGGVPAVAKVYEWSSASGQDRHSVHVAPTFQDPQGTVPSSSNENGDSPRDLHPAAVVSWGGGLPGARVGRGLEPKVELDRDGRPPAAREGRVGAGAYAYPAQPQPGPGWRRLAVDLGGRGPRQSAAVYTPDGSLVPHAPGRRGRRTRAVVGRPRRSGSAPARRALPGAGHNARRAPRGRWRRGRQRQSAKRIQLRQCRPGRVPARRRLRRHHDLRRGGLSAAALFGQRPGGLRFQSGPRKTTRPLPRQLPCGRRGQPRLRRTKIGMTPVSGRPRPATICTE